MRTISTAFTNKITGERRIGVQGIVRMNRLVFDTGNTITADTNLLSSYYVKHMDSADCSGGILRIASVESKASGGDDYLAWQYVSNPAAAPSGWAAWNVTGNMLTYGCKPGVYDNRIFFQKHDLNFAYADYSGGSLGSPVTFGAGVDVKVTGFAPVSKAVCFVTETKEEVTYFDQTYITFFEGIGTSPVHYHAPRALYGNFHAPEHKYSLDAVRVGTDDYLFVSGGYKGNRAEYLIRNGKGIWSQIHPVLDLDIIDDTTKYLLQSATVIEDRIFVVLDYIRDGTEKVFSTEPGHDDVVAITGSSFIGYSMGPPPFTFGRDIYIRDGVFGAEYINGVLVFRSGGKLHYLNGVIYYIGAGAVYTADSVYYTGDDASEYKLTFTGLDDITIENLSNSPMMLMAHVGGTYKDNSLLAPGNEIELYAKLDTEVALLGTFGIDAYVTDRTQEGQSKSLAGRGLGYKRLSQWTCDAYYDLWSQIKQSCNPSTLTEVIRMFGHWSTEAVLDNAIRLDDLNTHGILYSAFPSSKNSIARGMFYFKTETNFNPVAGVMCNVYQVTDPSNPDNLTWSGFLGTVDADTDMAYIYYAYSGGSWAIQSSAAYTVPMDQWFWLQLEYTDGTLILKARLNTSTSWTTIIAETQFQSSAFSPFGAQTDRGRPGIYMYNGTPFSETMEFMSGDMVIPVMDSSIFTAPSTVVVGEEQITISALSTQPSGSALDKSVINGWTFPEAPHVNANWINGVVMSHTDDGTTDQYLCQASTNKILSWSIKTPGLIQDAEGVKVYVKKVGSPSGSLYAYLCNMTWDDAGTPTWSAELAHGAVAASSITTSYQWITINFDVHAASLPGGWYYLALTNCDKSGTPTYNASNYFVVGVDESAWMDEGQCKLWDGPGFVDRSEVCQVDYKLIGDASFGGDGYDIYCVGPGGNYARTYFNGNALRVKSGPAEGKIFKITDYDYQCPQQWKPNRTYVPPDRWQDHVGDGAHGAWQNWAAMRIFVETDPSGAIAPGSVLTIYGGLVVNERGTNDTAETAHPAGICSQYTDTSVLCNRFEYFSQDVDLSIGDVARDICRKAGVWNLYDQKLYNETFVYSSGGLELLTDQIDHRNLILKVSVPHDGSETITRICFHYTKDGSAYIGGMYIDLAHDGISIYHDPLYSNKSDQTLLYSTTEWTELYYGMLTISVQEEYISIWYNDILLVSYRDTALYNGSYAWVEAVWESGNTGEEIVLDWSACDRRIDNFSLDQGMRGAQILSTLIGSKRYYIIDADDGGIKMLTDTTAVPGTYSLSALAGTGTSEMDIATRVRLLGLVDREVKDTEAMRLYGNLYYEINDEDAETELEVAVDAETTLDELMRKRGMHSLIGAADPRIEPRDLITYTLEDGVTEYTAIIEGLSINLTAAGDTPVFDMKLEGTDA